MFDLGRSLSHPFEDRDWAVKMLVGAGVNLVPVLNFALYGYAMDHLRNTERSQDVPLPKWDDLGKHFVDGLKLFVAQLIYSIPIIALVVGLSVISIIYGVSMEDSSGSARDVMTAGLVVVIVTLTCLSLVYGLFFAFITPAMFIQVARTGEIGSAFRFNEMFALIKRRPTDYLIIVILPVALGIVLGVAFSVLAAIPFVGLCLYFPLLILALLATPYMYIVSGHWYGQLLRD